MTLNVSYKSIGKQLYSLCFLSLFLIHTTALSQSFPIPSTLSTGQAPAGSNDPTWQISQVFNSSTPPSPTNPSVVFSAAEVQGSCSPSWVVPSSLPSPVNNGNWISDQGANCDDSNNGGYRYFRLPLTLPPNCGTVSVTSPGAYILTFDGYVDDVISSVFLNGVNTGIAPGGSFSPGNQLTFTINGPWQVGLNYIDILVYNNFDVNHPNPYGLLLVASPNSTTDSDGDGVLDINDDCVCDYGNDAVGCITTAPNDCNLPLIRSTFANAGCTELIGCDNTCSLYFYNPQTLTGGAAQAFAQNFGCNLISIQTAAENQCIISSLSNQGFLNSNADVVWIGFGDQITEGNFAWYDQSSISYTNWSSGEPNNSDGDEDCVQLYLDGSWNDLNCGNYNSKSIIEVNLCPVTTIVPSATVICTGQSVSLTASTILGSFPFSYTWTASGLSGNVATSAVVNLSPTETTTYTVKSVDRFGCTAYRTIVITVNPLPVITAPSATICIGQQTATLTATGASTYSWSPATGLSSAVGSMVMANPNLTTVYTISATDANNCVNTQTISVVVHPLPVITATSGTICLGQQTATLTAGGAITYSWSPNTNLNTTTGSVVMANPTANTTYSVGGIDMNGCANFGTTTVTVQSLPVISVTSGTICMGQQTAPLNAGGAATYSWTPATGLNTTTGASVMANPNATTTYSVEGIDMNGCANYTTTVLLVNPLPQPAFTFVNACINEQPVSFDGTSSTTAVGSNTLFAWAYGDGATGTGSLITHVYNLPVTYNVTLTVTSDIGCYSSTSQQIEVYPKPLMNILASEKVCLGSSTSFTANALANSGSVNIWLWDINNSITSTEKNGIQSSYQFPSAGTQTITLISITNYNCRDTTSRSVYINYNPAPQFTANFPKGCPLPHCVVFSDHSVAVPLPAHINTWQWNFGDGKTTTATTNADQSNCYYNSSNSLSSLFTVTLTLTTDSGCVGSIIKPDYITVYPKPIALYSITPDFGNVVEPSVYFNNQSVNYTKYWWSFGDGPFIDSVNVNPKHYYTSSNAASYLSNLVVANQYGCTDTSYVLVDIKPDFVFYIPNAFTPNNDGLNDVFTGMGMGIESYEMWIFDRWGANIFHTNDISNGWDGKLKDDEIKQDVYIWTVKLKDVLGKTHSYTGHVTLLR